MTEFENYTVTSKDYDKGRVPVGIEVILGALTISTKKVLRELQILDVGCGTGNYVVALHEHVGKVTGLDLNLGMLEQAKRKTSACNNVKLLQGDATNLPFPDDSFDGAICNQVLHHLQPAAATSFDNVAKFVKEVFRVLRPGGALIVNTATQEQASTANWVTRLIPEACARLAKRYPPVPHLCQLMEQAGLRVGSAYCLTRQTFMKLEVMLDKQGPFDPHWRNMNSKWALATPEEVQAALDKWRKILDEGKADEFIAQCEEHRRRVGQSVSVVAFKPV